VTGTVERRRVAPAALLPALVVVGAGVLVYAATSGPVGVMTASGRRVHFGTQLPKRAASASQTTGNLRETTAHVQQQLDLAWLGNLIATLLLVGVGLALFLAARAAWRRRWRPPAKPPEVDFDVLPGPELARAMVRGRDDQLAAVAEGTPRNGIVACWVRLEETVAEAGVRPLPSETSSELATRVLHALDVDPRAVGTLARLYREARFSEHELGEDVRAQARETLVEVHDELARRGAVR
jgi:hypothetical protein